MDSFGAYLKREREMRSVSLREIGQATKISTQSLEALEEENFQIIGAEIFIRGFVRSYARYLGMDVEDVLLRYDEFRQTQEPLNEQAKRAEDFLFLDQGKSGIPWLTVGFALVLVVGVGIWFMLVELPDDRSPASAEIPVRVELPEAPAAITGAAVDVVEVDETAAVAPQKSLAEPQVNLVIFAQRVSYIKLWIDEDNPVERMMQAGTEWHVSGRERIEMLTGNAGGVTLHLNGKELPRLGPTGGVRRQVITREGVSAP